MFKISNVNEGFSCFYGIPVFERQKCRHIFVDKDSGTKQRVVYSMIIYKVSKYRVIKHKEVSIYLFFKLLFPQLV